jgi:DNA-binding CsgD family transcriptional regulator
LATLVLTIANALLFAVIGVLSHRAGRQATNQRFRALAQVVLLCCCAFVLGSAHRVLIQGIELGLVDDRADDLIQGSVHMVKLVASMSLGLVGVVVLRRAHVAAAQLERIAVSIGSQAAAADTETWNLTSREKEVLALLVQGVTNDAELAQQLHISPATAKTHVRNIMGKASVSTRGGLVALVLAEAHRQGDQH